jgi:hypothetical protein
VDIQILPFWKYTESADDSFDLVLNQDPLPEMSHEAATGYVQATVGKSRMFFLSINHEAEPVMTSQGTRQNVVRDCVETVKGYTCVYWFPFWLRRGYVEELFAVDRPH